MIELGINLKDPQSLLMRDEFEGMHEKLFVRVLWS
jgi:hypothetical protein